MEMTLLVAAVLGHFMACVAWVNRIHGSGWPRWALTALSVLGWSTLLLAPAALFLRPGYSSVAAVSDGYWLPLVYLVPCWAMFLWSVLVRLHELVEQPHRTRLLREHRQAVIDTTQTLPQPPVSGTTAWMARLPGNEILLLSMHEKAIQLPRLPQCLDGLAIAHLSDLHMCGRIERAYFEEVVQRTNAALPDLTVITGDIFDAVECLDWIDATLARLEAPYGVYFILGNHDLRVDAELARRLLVGAGLHDLGSRCEELLIDGQRILLAGNELPWLGSAPVLPGGRSPGHRELRILLSHSPDQIHRARREQFDLMLAGHTHGGQIRLPLVGPVLSPTRMGTRFAAGTFYVEPTVLHVSQGVSSLAPFRWGCMPEVSLLRLRSATVGEDVAHVAVAAT